jgi:hypothetical protein
MRDAIVRITPDKFIRPTSINWVCLKGIQLEYEGVNERALINAGLITRADLPGPKRGCANYQNDFSIRRRADGAVNATFRADRVLSCDIRLRRCLDEVLAMAGVALRRARCK